MPEPHLPAVILIIMDGFGSAPAGLQGNAVLMAKTPNLMSLWANYPHTELFAHGSHVGLPKRQPGNSEAGHMNLGAGRIVKQDAVYISEAIEDGTFFRNTAFLETAKHVLKYGTTAHLMGMISTGKSAHASMDHLYGLLEFCRQQKIQKVRLHLFTDGRDGPRFAAPAQIREIESRLQPHEKIASICGRFYAMDRNKNWARLGLAYHCVVAGEGIAAPDAESALLMAYNRGETDEFVIPTVIVDQDHMPIGQVGDNDGVYFFNLRSDRARQLTKAFVQPDFEQVNPGAFERRVIARNIRFTAMTDFGPDLPHVFTAFPARDIKNTLPDVLAGLSQLYVAESEKFSHITYFFNGGRVELLDKEERLKIPSLNIPRYDMAPFMRTPEITDTVINRYQGNGYRFIAVNFANADMVAHTGNLTAAIEAVESIDKCLGKLWAAVKAKGGYLVITADHGNVEEMIDTTTGAVMTEHSIYPVPFIIAGPGLEGFRELPRGILADVAPTILDVMGMRQPLEMTGRSLLSE
jgi:2,3-bisphosphoglycerate-independent phosphoglycerate mutase